MSEEELDYHFSMKRITGWIGYAPREWSISMGFRWCGFGGPDFSIIQMYWGFLAIYGEVHINEW